MNIVMLDPANLTPFYTYALCESLATEGHSVKFYSTQYDNDLSLQPPNSITFVDHYFSAFRSMQSNGNKKLRQVIRGLSYLPDHLKLLSKLKKDKPDIVHIQWARLPKLDLWLTKQLQKLNIKVVMTVHDVNPLFDFGGDAPLSKLYNQVDEIIVHHTDAINVLTNRFSVTNRKKINVIPHGPLQAENIPQGKQRSDAREALNIPSNADVVTFFGEVKYYKGLDILIEAVALASKQCPSLYLLMAGRPGGVDDIPAMTPLTSNNIAHQANFSFIPNDDVWKYYLAANIVALPYREISQSGVLFSALAHERFVLCSAVGGLPELLELVGGGAVVEKENVALLSNKIVELVSDKHDLDVQAKNAKIKLFDVCSWEIIANKTTAVYHR